jgi:hypothetical protein
VLAGLNAQREQRPRGGAGLGVQGGKRPPVAELREHQHVPRRVLRPGLGKDAGDR